MSTCYFDLEGVQGLGLSDSSTIFNIGMYKKSIQFKWNCALVIILRVRRKMMNELANISKND